MSDGGEDRTNAPQPEPAAQAPAGWYPDPWTPSRRRYWNGSSWTFASTVPVPVDHPPPADATPLAEGHGLPAPVVHRPAEDSPDPPAKPPQKPIKWVLAVVVGLLVGLIGVALTVRSSSHDGSSRADSVFGPTPTTVPSGSPAPRSPTDNNDPSTAALGSLIVKPEDVPATSKVVLFEGGIGLGQPTLDLCNGTYGSESRRTARVQDAVLDGQGTLVLSTEAVLYGDSAGTTQAFSELRSVTAACPPTPVQGEITTFNPPPDAGWAQTASVNRLAYDLTTDDGTGRARHTVAVYLQRGRALLGVYFSQPDGPQAPVGGQTTIEGIVGVFAARLAALPTSVVGA